MDEGMVEGDVGEAEVEALGDGEGVGERILEELGRERLGGGEIGGERFGGGGEGFWVEREEVGF